MENNFRITDFNPSLTTGWVAAAIRASVQYQQPAQAAQRNQQRLNGITTDSRLLQSGDLFVPLRGEHSDGHTYIPQAIRAGASAIICANDYLPHQSHDQTLLLRVDDTLAALGDLAHAWRKQFSLPLLSLTGSNGKTTTKEIALTILEGAGETLATYGNWNNLIGVPLTLLKLRPQHAYGVIEMGMNQFGEIARLSEISTTDFRLITNIMPVHLAGVGDIAGVQRAKAELVQQIQRQQTFIVNADDPRVVAIAAAVDCQKIFYSQALRRIECNGSQPVMVRLLDVRPQQPHGWQGTIEIAQHPCNFTFPLSGEHNLSNMLAAAAATFAMGISPGQIAASLAHIKTSPMRHQWLTMHDDIRLYNDCYNANPGSMAAALKAIAQLHAGRHLAVLGDMWELGATSLQQHRQILELARQLDFDFIFCLGPQFREAAVGLSGSGWLRCYDDIEAMNGELSALLQPQDMVLIKGSRAMKLERVSQHLLTRFEAKEV